MIIHRKGKPKNYVPKKIKEENMLSYTVFTVFIFGSETSLKMGSP